MMSGTLDLFSIVSGLISWMLIAFMAWVTATVTASSWQEAALLGALNGFTIYGVYNTTNLATLTQWRVVPAIVDTAWGTALSSALATSMWFMAN